MAAVVPMHFDWSTSDVLDMYERKSLEAFTEKLGGLSGITARLKTDPERGVSDDTVELRRAQWGLNQLDMKDPVTFLEFLYEAFQDKIVLILMGAAVVSIIFGLTLEDAHTGKVERERGWIEGFAVLLSVAVVTLTASVNNYQKAKKFEEMERDQNIKDVQVVRNGKEITVPSPEVVVGDVLVVEAGSQLICDGVLISGEGDIKCNEVNVTGESEPIEKSFAKDPFFISGSTLDEGAVRLLCIAVGKYSFSGNLKKTVEDEEVGETPLQEHLGALADNIGKVGAVMAIFLVAALSIKEGILISQDKKSAQAQSFLNFIIVAITLVVVAIPEGLHLAVTISLAFSMKAMMQDQCMVRVLESCETMGAATAIASDKTGTLTTNKMTVVQGLMMEEEFALNGYGLHVRSNTVNQFDRNNTAFRTAKDNIERFCFALSVNSTAREQEIDGKVVWIGNKTEHGLLGFVNLLQHSYKTMRASVGADNTRQFPFNSAKKRMSTVVKDKTGSLSLYCKGASEVILEDCDRYADKDGNVAELTDAKRGLFMEIINDMAANGNRTIGMASAPLLLTEMPTEEPNTRMVFLGVLGIQDPIRETVPTAVANCHTAGITVRMVTGDNINTAIAIAKKCGIYHDNGWDHAMTGIEFRQLAENDRPKLLEILPRLRILARSSPTDKFVLVGALQELGEVVGVTGDGTNDAPALKLSDVGFAMNSGTDIAKSAADMVLLDDNFASVVNAVRWGRAVNDNIRKFLQFQLTINVSGVLLTLIGSLASSQSKEPLTPVQLLWLNLIMDTLAALALATELPEDACLLRPPIFKQAPLVSHRMRAFIGIHGLYQVTVILLVLFGGAHWFQTIEHEGSCDKDFPLVPRWLFVNGTNTNIQARDNNGTGNPQWDRHPSQIYCDNVCKNDGGALDGRVCVQGRTHGTMIFNTFIWMQIFNIPNARKLFGEINPFEGILTRSQMLLKVFTIIIAFQLIAVNLFDRFMQVTRISAKHWGICLALAIGILPLGFLPRMIPVTEPVPEIVTAKQRKEIELRESAAKEHRATALVHKDPSLRRSSSIFKGQRRMSGGPGAAA